MAFDINDIDKLYYKKYIDGEYHALGEAIDFEISDDTLKKKNREFKPGDLVEIKSWDEMEKEFGTYANGTIKAQFGFTKEMEQYCGLKTTIERIADGGRVYFKDDTRKFLFSTDMIKHIDHSYVVDNSIHKINVEDTPRALDIARLYPEIMFSDTIDCKKYCETDLEITKEGCDAFKALVQGIIEDKKDKKKEEDNMELIKIYRENAEKVIVEAIKNETETRMEKDSFISTYNKLIANFEKDLTKLYEKQPLTDRRLDKCCISNMYGIRISCSYKDDITTDVSATYTKYIAELDEKLTEVQAQLDIIRKANPTNSYELTMNVLRNYGIVDENNMLNKYELPVVESKVEVVEENATESEKRGRKPKIQKEQ